MLGELREGKLHEQFLWGGAGNGRGDSAPRQSLTRQDWHRVLKSGCGIEQVTHRTAERIRRALAISMVVAWRIMLMTLLGREAPDLPPDVLFSDIEMHVLRTYAKKNG